MNTNLFICIQFTHTTPRVTINSIYNFVYDNFIHGFNLQIQLSNLQIVSPTLGDSLIALPTLNDPQIPPPALISPPAATPSVLKVREETCGRNYGNFKDQC